MPETKPRLWRRDGLKQVCHVLTIGQVDAALNATKTEALQHLGNVGVGLRHTLRMMSLRVGDDKIKSNGEHQSTGSARIFASA
jgi:hypothetical protein